ncbi:MAG: class I SAM-dependent methyltransferase [Rhodospirillales bacterium]|nr:class I SAM-dependent methyltransferase [Rhodospirillales bacterium]
MGVQGLDIKERHAPAVAGHCRLCGEALSESFVDLGMSPLCESYRTAEQLDQMEPFYPLHALVCGSCFLVQLKEYVSPGDIFGEYAYFSSYSTSWVAHARAYCHMIKARLGLGPRSFVVELASNDGYLLQHFLPLGVPVLGIEPAANVAKAARDKGVETRVGFFGARLAAALLMEAGPADLIIANNVLAHVPDLNDFTAGMARLLAPEGVITTEFPHLERLMADRQFDTIYHEHFSYFSLGTVCRLAARHGLKVFDVEELPTHGGSLRVYFARQGSGHAVMPAVPRLIERERRLGFGEMATYRAFGEQVKATKRQLLSFLIEAKGAGKRICGYGAPGKGNTLLNYCGIGPDFIDFTVDRNTYKHGKFTPGVHIPILPVGALDAARPDYVLILPWNLRDEIVAQMRHIGTWGGRFVVAIPRVTLIDPREVRP